MGSGRGHRPARGGRHDGPSTRWSRSAWCASHEEGRSRCRHLHPPAAALNEGYLQDDDTLICPAHNSCFDLHTGEPIGIPAVKAIPVYACKIEDEAIWVDFDQQLNDADIPHKPYH